MRRLARRSLMIGTAMLGAAPATTRSWAQSWPTKPVKIVVPFGPGGPADVYARFLGQALTESLGQQFIIDNKPGAGAIIGTSVVAKAAPDGYTLLMMSNTHTTNETLFTHKPYQLMRDPLNRGQIVALQKIDHFAHVAGKPVNKFRHDLHDPRIASQAALDENGTAGIGSRKGRPGGVRCSAIVGHGCRISPEVLPDRSQERILLNGLTQVSTASGGQAFVAVFRHGVRSQRDDRYFQPPAA